MMKLPMAAQQRAKSFMHSQARPLERALYDFHIGKAGPAGVVQALAAFQNGDGGFGHGVEPDLPMPHSSVLCTVRALQVLAEAGTPQGSPLVAGGIRYLLSTYDPQTGVWEIVPRAVNDGPRAPWWTYDDKGQAERWGGYRVNPRAEVLGCLYDYSALVPPDFLGHVTADMSAHLESQPQPKDMHELKCYLVLLDTKSLPGDFRKLLLSRLEPAVASAVERDPAKWGGYCLKPAGYMCVVESPTSPFADLLAREVELCLDFEISRQHADGSWLPTWSWGPEYPEAWAQAKLAWQGILTVHTLRMLAAFDRL